ncbi:MAG: thiamine-binding protein [Treponema sp.]|nr:thiamine-binding protein [Treponema sp.]
MERPEASIAIQTLPQSVSGGEILKIVDKVIGYIKSTGLKTVVGPFETVIEGDFNKLMDIAKECQLICIREGAPGLLTYLKIAYNPNGGIWSIDEKISKHS